MNVRRILLGVIGGVMLLAAMVTYFAVGLTENNAFIVGVCSKVGLVLLTIFLAWPALERFVDRAPLIVNGALLAALVFIAIRPKLFPLVIALTVVTLVVHFGLRFASRKFDGKN